MSELGETFKAMREESQERRAANKARGIAELEAAEISYDQLSSDHFRVGEFDYWPSTGLFMHLKTKRRSRGIRRLLAELERTEKP